jgi:hypothetical protein
MTVVCRRVCGASSVRETAAIKQAFFVVALVLGLAAAPSHVTGQALPATDNAGRLLPASQPLRLFEYSDSQIKFNLEDLMSTLRDHQHEGWVLAAYPDPKTSRPLIGAGFSLDVPAREHPQMDPLNPNRFLEPSSAQLWQAAGLDPERLQVILERFDRDMNAWSKKKYRRKIVKHALPPDLTEEEATALLRISSIQAVENARGYCRDFDELTASQQMALSQLVFQMGVNLEQFVGFLSAINGDNRAESNEEHWKTVQHRLIDSQWATRYTTRATSVIAMFDPEYAQNSKMAKLSVQAVLVPPVQHTRKASRSKSLNVKYERGHKTAKKSSLRHKSKLT